MLIGVISDTHKLVRESALLALAGVDVLLHAGDVGAPAVLSTLASIAPVHAVRGNVDRDEWADVLPASCDLEFDGVHIHMRHDRHSPVAPGHDAAFDVVISGHSHKPGLDTVGSVLYLNPGSAGPRRFSLPISEALITAADGQCRAELVTLDN